MSDTRFSHIDALRGLALLGICMVNVWAFAYGYQSDHLSMIPRLAGWSDWFAMGAVSWLVEGKFYPIFAFLFGAGFWLMRGRDRSGAFRERYQRRMSWLLVVGLLHACLLYAGDILRMYAVFGFVLLSAGLGRPRHILRWLCILVAIILVGAVLGAVFSPSMRYEAWASSLAESQQAYTTALQQSWWATTPQRLKEFMISSAALVFGLPEILSYFLLGVLSVRLGLLTHPSRHVGFWRRTALAGLGLGLPLNLLFAYAAMGPFGQLRPPLPWEAVVISFWTPVHAVLAAGYVAAFVLASQRLVPWLAPAGRMALTNYLTQSVVGAFLVQATWTRAELLAYCVLLFGAQMALSHWWLERFGMGPVERMWRRYTYGKAGSDPKV